MYDELVKRLRTAAKWADSEMLIMPSILTEAADAIDDLSESYEKLSKHMDSVMELAKLPKEET